LSSSHTARGNRPILAGSPMRSVGMLSYRHATRHLGFGLSFFNIFDLSTIN
jgi:hypothetical protein